MKSRRQVPRCVRLMQFLGQKKQKKVPSKNEWKCGKLFRLDPSIGPPSNTMQESEGMKLKQRGINYTKNKGWNVCTFYFYKAQLNLSVSPFKYCSNPSESIFLSMFQQIRIHLPVPVPARLNPSPCTCSKPSESVSIYLFQHIWIHQRWALALFFPGLLSAQFLTMDRYRSITHFADFQVCSSLHRSQKDQWFALGKEGKNAWSLLRLQRFALFKICALPPPPPPSVN